MAQGACEIVRVLEQSLGPQLFLEDVLPLRPSDSQNQTMAVLAVFQGTVLLSSLNIRARYTVPSARLRAFCSHEISSLIYNEERTE